MFKVSPVPAVAVTLFATLFACNGNSDSTHFQLESDAAIPPVHIIRLDKTIESFPTLDSLDRTKTIRENYTEILWYGKILGPETDTVLPSNVLAWAGLPATESFMPLVDKIYGNLSDEEASFAKIVATAKINNLVLPAENLVTVVWSNPKSIIIVDSINTAYLALNHYLGSESPAYSDWAYYRRKLKNREMIPVDIAESLLAISYPYKNEEENNTVLSRLLYEGSLAIAKEAMVPDASLASVLGFTESEMEDIIKNEDFIRKQLIDGKLLYSSDDKVKSNLFEPSPASTMISSDAPGRAIRYIGYRIVREYLKTNPETSLSYLLSPDFYNNGVNVLRNSHFVSEY